MTFDVLPDIPRELTGLAEWAACMVYVLLRQQRLRPSRLAVLSAVALVVLVGVQVGAGMLPLAWWPVGMAASAACMYAFIYAAARLPVKDAGYFCARALVLAELVAALHWQMHCFFFLRDGDMASPSRIMLFAVVYVAAFAVAYVVESRHFRPSQPLDVTGRDVASAAAIALVTFGMSNLSFLNASTPFSGRLGFEIFYIRTLVDLCGFVALYAQQGQRLQQHAKGELKAIDEILRSQHQQYLQSKRSIERVNRKYHDLKHQVGVIRAEVDPGKQASYLDELEATIKDVDTQSKTGSSVLDVILTTKHLECVERDVDLTCVADGSLLGFMTVMDVSALFGNALDNAIDGASRVEDPEKRLVKMALFARDELVVMTFENYFDGDVRTEAGQVVTRRSDRDRHGYGLKSLRYTAEKYGGSMTVRTDGDWFVVRILVPLPRDYVRTEQAERQIA
ncbi:histidine kinase [Sanguibacter keddieii DSM 10542]|uniref:Histidine kinase n=1 Tax=Sanguibacter keddieii (strain ATCC 51767 / DSM 10542 / NCFB 3025 / ST-74) TaxID=446469 RepID=D1BJ02_SANKS|nr:sensor histidine kinase [Sanguibacter keddieii]ACZ20194.1 histidine kinase [Sanguibacter keddieii DSM 10542]